MDSIEVTLSYSSRMFLYAFDLTDQQTDSVTFCILLVGFFCTTSSPCSYSRCSCSSFPPSVSTLYPSSLTLLVLVQSEYIYNHDIEKSTIQLTSVRLTQINWRRPGKFVTCKGVPNLMKYWRIWTENQQVRAKWQV